jgi:hypothetical protein
MGGREREDEAARLARDRPRGGLLGPGFDREIEVPDFLSEQRVADGAADDPGGLAVQRSARHARGRGPQQRRLQRRAHEKCALGTRGEIPQVIS